MPNKLSIRFAELADEVEKLAKSIPATYDGEVAQFYSNAILSWTVKAKHLLGAACGEDSAHCREFNQSDAMHRHFGPEYRVKLLMAVFAAARDDFDGGYVTTFRSIVEAELFSTELEQATELLDKRYKTAAAVIAGTVLETALRTLSDRNQIPLAMIGKMNDDLARKGVYNALMHKRILSLAQVRNDAAHGNPNQFTDADVKTMIADVERFLAEHLI